jgi:hypothetical protein
MTTVTRRLDAHPTAPPAAPAEATDGRGPLHRAMRCTRGASLPPRDRGDGGDLVRVRLGIGSLVLVIGVPILVGSLYVARGFAEAERALLRMTDHPPIAAPDWRRGTRAGGRWARLTQPLRNAHYWMALLSALLVRPIVAIVGFAFALIWIVLALGGPTYWFWSPFTENGSAEKVWVPWAVQHIFGGIDPSPDPHRWASMLYLVVGLVFLATLPLVLRGLVRLHGSAPLRWWVAGSRTTSRPRSWASTPRSARRAPRMRSAPAGARSARRSAAAPGAPADGSRGPRAPRGRRDAEAVAALAQESRGHAQAALDELRALAGGVARRCSRIAGSPRRSRPWRRRACPVHASVGPTSPRL